MTATMKHRMNRRRMAHGKKASLPLTTSPTRSMFLSIDTTLETGTAYTLPLYGSVDVDVDWGDGTQNSYTTTGDKTHTYAAEGTYNIRITGTLTRFGKSTAAVANIAKLTACGSWGALGLASLSGAFLGASNLMALPIWIPSTVTDIGDFLYGCTSFNQSLNTWATGNIENMRAAFFGCDAYNQPMSNWDMSSATNTAYMLYSCDVFNQPLPATTGNVTTMSNMLRSCVAFDQNLGSMDVTSVTDASDMLKGLTLSTPNYDALLIGWESQAVNDNVPFDGGYSTYSAAPSAAATARDNLTKAVVDGGHGWTITDSGPA